jgi:hypothetical protein
MNHGEKPGSSVRRWGETGEDFGEFPSPVGGLGMTHALRERSAKARDKRVKPGGLGGCKNVLLGGMKLQTLL